MEIPFAWPLWSPFDGKEEMRKQVQRIRENLSLLPTRMSADEKGLMALGLLFALVQLFPLQETLKTSRGNLRLWGCLTVLLYLGGYIPILVFDRYLSPISGMLIVLCVSGPEPGWLNTLLSKRSVAEQPLAKFHSLLSIGHGVFLAVLAGALLFSLRGRLWMEFRQNGWVDQAAVFKQVGEALKGRTVLAANDWNRGLHVAYWAKSQFIGAVEGKQPERIARELVAFGRPVLLVFGDKELMGALAASPLFAPVALNGRNFLWVFEIRKDADDQNLPTKPN